MNSAVFAPIPSASVRITIAVKTGLRRIMRAAKRMSPRTLCMKPVIEVVSTPLSTVTKPNFGVPYSSRNVSAGSMRAIRRVGTVAAMMAADARTSTAERIAVMS
jgi:hypothetical protein